jgi:DNA-binding beta-propeller fold protein YncE
MRAATSLIAAVATTAAFAAAATNSFIAFESGQVRPLAMSADKSLIFAVNTPDNRLEILRAETNRLVQIHSVPVGMEPVSVAVRNKNEVWVVNHLSDSISIVRLDGDNPRVVHTLLVGDEPRDIVFAGKNKSRAFITTAHRGQNSPINPQLKTPGVGRADVWVFDANVPGDGLGGKPLTILSMFGDTPRALATNNDGSLVYAAVFNSGNQTTVLQGDLPNGGLQKSSPSTNTAGEQAVATGLIVKYDGTNWVDTGNVLAGEAPKIWNDRVRFSLPDNDVFVIDANAKLPKKIAEYKGVGTTLFNMAVNPKTNALYVSNTQARNHIRFEGPGSISSTVRGNFVQSRITVIDDGKVLPRHLNKHIQSYDRELGTEAERRLSLATPLDMVISKDGKKLYLAGFGSQKIGIYSTDELKTDRFTPSLDQQINLTGGGPSGLVLDDENQRLFVMTRFDNSVAMINAKTRKEVAKLALYNPEPRSIVEGRKFLYDATLTSSRGDSSCGGCHIFGDMDHIAWDLGNPDGAKADNPRQYVDFFVAFSQFTKPFFNSMKGPMTTQSLRGMTGNGPMHWRGDRTGITHDADETLEEQAFEDFNVAFTGLLGRSAQLSDEEIDAFAKFAMQLTYPPSPIRQLNNALTPSQAAGENVFRNFLSTGPGLMTCNECHTVDIAAGKFGTSGLMAAEGDGLAENFKVPHLRNLYQKVGMFGSTGNPNDGYPFTGEQIRGFGYQGDGTIDTVSEFLTLEFNLFQFNSETDKQNVVDFVLAMVGEMAPIVGQQVTINSKNIFNREALERVKLLYKRSQVKTPRAECDLILKGELDGRSVNGLLTQGGVFKLDGLKKAPQDLSSLLVALSNKSNSLTFTCVPPGSGYRMGLDRDEDGILDSDDVL